MKFPQSRNKKTLVERRGNNKLYTVINSKLIIYLLFSISSLVIFTAIKLRKVNLDAMIINARNIPKNK